VSGIAKGLKGLSIQSKKLTLHDKGKLRVTVKAVLRKNYPGEYFFHSIACYYGYKTAEKDIFILGTKFAVYL
jgi:hypothetical protein